MSAVAVSVIAGLFGILTILVQAVVHRDNRKDHAATAQMVERMALDVHDVKDDIRDVKADVREHRTRLGVIEARLPKETP